MKYVPGEVYQISRPSSRYRDGRSNLFPAVFLEVRQFTKNLKAYAFQYAGGDRAGREFLIPISKPTKGKEQ